MPTYLHELLVLLFRNRPTSAAELLRQFDVQLSEYDEVRFESLDLNNLQPAEYRADLVSFLVQGSDKVLGVIVEVQLARDEDKRYASPAYVANLRARHRCPVCLLVVTIEESVARWAGKLLNWGRARDVSRGWWDLRMRRWSPNCRTLPRTLSSPFCRRSSTGRALILPWPSASPPSPSAPAPVSTLSVPGCTLTEILSAQAPRFSHGVSAVRRL